MKEREIIKNLEDIFPKAARTMQSLSFENRKKYSQYLLKGKDCCAKLPLMFTYNLWTEANIKNLVDSNVSLIEKYLQWIQTSLHQKMPAYGYKTFFSTFKEEIYRKGRGDLFLLYETYFPLYSSDEISLIKIRKQQKTSSEPDEFLVWYWQTHRLKKETLLFLQKTENLPMWQEYQEISGMLRFQKLCVQR